MSEQKDPKPGDIGIAGLPRNWAIAVQLIGTFGLAVFLVLYYVIVLQPREAARYEQLQQSVASLGEIIVDQQSMLTREQESRLEDLFVLAMTREVAELIIGELKGAPTAEALAKKIEDRLIFQTRLLAGLRRKDERAISEGLTHKIRNSEISQKLAQIAIAEWKDAEPELIADESRGALDFAIKRAAMAK